MKLFYRASTKDERRWIEQAASKHSEDYYTITMDNGAVFTLERSPCTWKQHNQGYLWELKLRNVHERFFSSIKDAKKWTCWRNAEQNPEYAQDLI